MKYGIFPGGNTNRRELTERETIILKLFCAHKSIIEISELMGLSEKTVNWYKHILLQKTNCKNADELILFAKKSNEYDNLSK
jgi:DNA-binding CsgD family transcriptional regulator